MPRDGPSLTVAAMNSSLTVATMNSFSNGSHHMSCHNAEGEAGARQVTDARRANHELCHTPLRGLKARQAPVK